MENTFGIFRYLPRSIYPHLDLIIREKRNERPFALQKGKPFPDTAAGSHSKSVESNWWDVASFKSARFKFFGVFPDPRVFVGH